MRVFSKSCTTVAKTFSLGKPCLRRWRSVAVLLGNALLGSGFGAAGGSLTGALIGWGIPEEQAKYYGELLSRGNYIVVVEGTEAEIKGAEAILLNRQINNWNTYQIPLQP